VNARCLNKNRTFAPYLIKNNNLRRRKTFRKPFKKEEPFKINEKIRAEEVRLVGDNVELGVYKTADAIKIAEDLELDLIEISPKAVPPVCKVLDYKKFLYEKKKRDKEIKANSQKTVIKEIRFGPNTDEHDFEFKLKHAIKFLSEGAKVKAFVFFRGRTIVFKDRGEILLLKLAQRLAEYGEIEQLPKLEGKRMIIFIAPKKKK
jgi:translation initiation factor IF-3